VQRFGRRSIPGLRHSSFFANDQITVDERNLRTGRPNRVIISPGPWARRTEAGISVECCQTTEGRLPLVSVMGLGPSSRWGKAFGRGRSSVAKNLIARQRPDHDPPQWPSVVSPGSTNPFQATRYHSLVISGPTRCPKISKMVTGVGRREEPGPATRERTHGNRPIATFRSSASSFHSGKLFDAFGGTTSCGRSWRHERKDSPQKTRSMERN